MIEPAEKIQRLELSRKSNTKTTPEEQHRLAVLEAKHSALVAEEFVSKREEFIANTLDIPLDFCYTEVRQSVEDIANQELPEPDTLNRGNINVQIYNWGVHETHLNAIWRKMQERADLLRAVVEILTDMWRGDTIETAEWKADAAGADLLADLRFRAKEADAFAHYCERAYRVVVANSFRLKSISENWDQTQVRGQVTFPSPEITTDL